MSEPKDVEGIVEKYATEFLSYMNGETGSKSFSEILRAAITEATAELKKDQSDWRKGVALIASAAGIDTLACVAISGKVLGLAAENDRYGAALNKIIYYCRKERKYNESLRLKEIENIALTARQGKEE